MARLIDRVFSRANEIAEGPYYSFASYYRQERPTEAMLPTFSAYASDGYSANGVVFAVILARLMLFSEAEFAFEDLATGKQFTTSALAPLQNPWDGGTTGELLARMEQDDSLAGNSFIYSDESSLRRLRPDWVSIAYADESRTDVLGYMYAPEGNVDDAEIFPPNLVAHWSPIPDPLAFGRGMSWMSPVVREINADSMMTDHKRSFFRNAGTPNTVITFKERQNDTALERLREQWNRRYSGPGRAGKTAVLDGGADLQVIGNSFEQMSFTQVQAAGENRIAAAAGVPGIVVGLKEGLQAATYSNYEQAMRRFADLTMRPLWRSCCASLSKLVDVPSGCRLTYDVSGIAALRQGEKERAETFKTKAFTATELIRGGYDPETVAQAVETGDLSQLKHTGAIPTALYPEGKQPQ